MPRLWPEPLIQTAIKLLVLRLPQQNIYRVPPEARLNISDHNSPPAPLLHSKTFTTQETYGRNPLASLALALIISLLLFPFFIHFAHSLVKFRNLFGRQNRAN